MYRQLLLKAFEKAGRDTRSEKPTRQARKLSEYIQEDSGEPYGEKSLRNHLRAVQEGRNVDLRNYVVNALCHYLGYTGWEDFVKDHPAQPTKTPGFLKRYRVAIFVGVLCTVTFLSIHYGTQTRWMVWEDDHYVEAAFEEQLLQEGKLKLYKEDRIQNFRKIEADCSTPYTTKDGNALLWYGKNNAGKLEFFTALGKHPETGKTLKEVTDYMFKKYICN